MSKILFKRTTQSKSVISYGEGRSYVVTRPCGKRITCHNLGTALWYVANPKAK